MKSTNKRVVISVVILIAICCGLSLVFYMPDSENRDPIPGAPRSFINYGVYTIDTDTILKSIDNGQFPIFLPETAHIPDSNTNDKLEWKQSEFWKVATALFEFKWKEPISKDWSINRMVFNKDCEENPVGFDNATFFFKQPFVYDKKPYYKYRSIEISLWEGTVAWGDGNSYPQSRLGTNEYHLNDLKISADDALSIAEENGGKASRQSVQNKCTIVLYLERNWKVEYYPSLLFEITIDPYTGK